MVPFCLYTICSGAENGLHLVGNPAQYAEIITNLNFTVVKIGSMGCSSILPQDADGNLIFVGTDNRSVFEIGITQ